MKIKGIIHERTEDAPFIGALIIANDCHNNCKGCFNQHLRQLPAIEMTASEIIAAVLSDKFNKGVILAGLEWTEQPDDLRAIYHEALNHGLQVIIFTNKTEEQFAAQFGDIMHDCYIKFGAYDETQKTDCNIQYGIKLATSNQKIKKF